jgi:hypothetical protein
MNTWLMALKHWNSMKGGPYKVPKKGTKEYNEVKAVQSSMVNGDGLVQLGVKPVTAPKALPKKKRGGEIINPNVDLISELNNLWKGLTGSGLSKKQMTTLRKKQNGGLGWGELSAINEVLYPLQPKLPSLDTKTGKPVPPSGPFDFLNF